MKKIIAVFITLATMFVSSFYIISAENNIASIESNDFELMFHNLDSGESSAIIIEQTNFSGTISVLESQEYNVRSTGFNPFIIIGADDRIRVNPNNSPYSRIVLIRAGFDTNNDGAIDRWEMGTGSLVGSDTILTAAHILHYQNKTASEIRIHTKQNGITLSNSFEVIPGYALPKNYKNETDHDYDWAVLKTRTKMGNTLGYFGYAVHNGIHNVNWDITVSGYPGDDKYYQNISKGKLNFISSYRFSHNADTDSGQSGAPVYDSNNIIRGIHTSGNEALKMNYGVRITTEVFDSIEYVRFNWPFFY